MRMRMALLAALLSTGLMAATALAAAEPPASSPASAPTTLKAAYSGDFYIGAAMNKAQITGKDKRGDAIIEAQFNTISPDNALKWERIHPKPGKYNFRLADKYVAFGQKHHMFIVGHNLVWHEQVPAWVFRDKHGKLLTRDALLKRMHDHIQTVVGRYKGRIQSWDVVNEALNEDGTLRQSLWYKIIGPDYIEKAFEYAHEADPNAQLTYNDYNLYKPAKRAGAIRLVKKLQAEGVPINCVGLQNHDSLDVPTAAEEDATISAFAALGVKVSISELDIDVLPSGGKQPSASVRQRALVDARLNPYVHGLPDAVQKRLAARYAELFRVFLKHRGEISRVTFWGVGDGDSWRNNFPIRGRTNYPLLFNRQDQPKPAFYAVLQVGAAAQKH